MKIIILALCILSFQSVFSQSQADALQALEMLRASGQVPEAELKKAEAQLTAMNKGDFDKMVKEAHRKASDPAFQANVISMYGKKTEEKNTKKSELKKISDIKEEEKEPIPDFAKPKAKPKKKRPRTISDL